MFVAGWGVPSWTLNIHQLWANTSEGASIRSLRIAVRYVRNVLSQVRASLQSGPRRHHACCRCRCLWLCVGDPLFFFFFFSSSLSFINPDPILEFFALFPVTFENSDMPINMSQFCLPVIMHECECGVQQDNPSDQPGDQEQ